MAVNPPPSSPPTSYLSFYDPPQNAPKVLKDRCEKKAKQMWNKFYQNKQGFVASSKERHYISVEFKNELQSLRSEAQKECRRVVGLEAGCGVGHAIAPLLAEFADISFIALDISPKAISLLKKNPSLPQDRVSAYVCDIQKEALPEGVGQVDFVMLIFVLSTIAPEQMQVVVTKLMQVIRPGGFLFVRDYGSGDCKHVLLEKRPERKLGPDFYARPDGTRVFFFTCEYLRQIMHAVDLSECKNQLMSTLVVNRKEKKEMNRVWIQAAFRKHV